MAEQLPSKAYVVAMTFGLPPAQVIMAQGVIAPNAQAAVGMAVSAAHIHSKIEQPLMGVAVDELTREFIEAARRGFVGEASVVSLVPQGTHGSKELDEDAAKLVAMGGDPGPVFLPCNHEWITPTNWADPLAPLETKCRLCGEFKTPPQPGAA